MKKSYSILLFLAALWLHTACTDSDYDLSDINTTSRFALNGLTLPLNIDPVQLDLMLDMHCQQHNHRARGCKPSS